MSMLVGLAVGLATLVGAPGARANPSALPERTWVTNGRVAAIVSSGGITYIGGLFSQVGPRTGPGVGIDRSSGQSTGLPEVSGGSAIVDAVVADGSGGWYIGGSFTH